MLLIIDADVFVLQVFVIDGRTGEVLWYKQTPANTYTVMPILTLSTKQKCRDAFVFSMSSTNMNFTDASSKAVSVLTI